MIDGSTAAPGATMNRWSTRPASVMHIAVPLYVVAIVAAEITLVFFDTTAGLIGHAALILLLLSHFLIGSWGTSPAAVATSAPYQALRVLPALALVPLLRLLSIVMPFSALPVWGWYPLVGGTILLATALTARALHYSWADLGLQRAQWVTQLLIALSGPPLGLMTYLLVKPDTYNLVGSRSSPTDIAAAIVALLFAGLVEESLFRGLLQRATGGIVWGSLLYGALYLGTLSPGLLLIMTLAGSFFSWCAARTGAIWGVILANGTLAATALVIWPLLLS